MKTRAAETAKEIRKELKVNFPNVKFQVKSSTYSGGNSVDIYYEDAVPTKAIEAVVNKYQQGHFNGMEDIYEYSNRNEDIPQVKYVMVNRSMSQEAEKQMIETHNELFVESCRVNPNDLNEWVEGMNAWGQTVVYRAFFQYDFEIGAFAEGTEYARMLSETLDYQNK